MVVIKEVGPENEMFWGVTLENGKTYTQTAQTSFHISMAAIEPKAGSKDLTSVYVRQNDQEYLLCTLQQGLLYQQALDLGFMAGESLTLFTSGKSTVHMTGYRVHDDSEDFEGGEDSDMMESSSEDEDVSPPLKKLKTTSGTSLKRGKQNVKAFDEVDSDDSDEEMDDLDGLLNLQAEESDEEMTKIMVPLVEAALATLKQNLKERDQLPHSKQTPNGKATSKSSDSSLKQAKTPQPASKKPQQQSKSPQQQGKTPQQKSKTPQQQGKTPQQQGKTPQQQGKTPQQQGKTPQQQGKTPKQGKDVKEPVKTPQQKQESKTPLKRKLPNGLVIEELKEGHGPEAKNNKMVHVYYTGKLSSGKVFDSSTTGKPFKFRLGKNEVIKGWEVGLQGMKVGGKRRLTVPPNLAYGNDRSSGLPPNSTLHFDIELKSTS
ncbi:FK506-bp1 [Bugula neritina]|uniref:FK506-binding protein n=1 Tax=Bugula neritina TaxID=10212 RepID=A0A7J7KQ07_BUGNE|nr:FK506-bp1 [Bugula neritina]